MVRDYSGIVKALMGEWDTTSQPLKERGIPGSEDLTNQGLLGMFSVPALANALAPVGTYEDGSTGLAWPQIVAGPAQSWKRMVDSAMAGDDAYFGSEQAARDSFDAAGLAMTGGLGVGLAGGMVDDAVRAALPMDDAARLARARGMGFDTENVWYHGSPHTFDEFEIGPKRVGTGGGDPYQPMSELGAFFTQDPEIAALYGPNVRPFYVRGEYPELYNPVANKPEAVDTIDQTVADMRQLLSRGYDGAKLTGPGTEPELAVFDPRNIRSVDAEFNPAMSGSANLLAANAPTGSSVPLAMNALERAGAQPQGIRAYHGSPHDFDRFSLDAIGTGEGAQAYGHGLYFAESEDVARSYRDALATTVAVDGKPLIQNNKRIGSTGNSDVDDLLIGYDGDVQKALQAIDGQPGWDEARAILQSIQPDVKNTGRMYEVNIRANPEDFLDWDKPLSQQSEKVREALKVFKGIPEADKLWSLSGPLRGDLPGESAVKHLAKILGGAEKVSEKLKEAGVAGVRYRDGSSRFGDQANYQNPNYNTVVFDDQLIDILRKYANAPTGSVIPLGMESQDQDTTTPALLEYLRAIGLN